MKLEQQVTSLRLSKKLKKLGVKQESLYWWSLRGQMGWTIENNFFMQTTVAKGKSYCSAFTASEIYELLGERIVIESGKKNIANILAKLLIDKLKENKLIK